MPRIPRSCLPDGFFHVTARGVAQMPIFLDDEDRRRFLRLLAGVARLLGWECHALCLMDNHYHLVLEATQPRLSVGMHRLNGVYAEGFNNKYERWGHVFGDRFGARVIEDERYLMKACRYVLDNPVRAGLCERARDWRWNACRYGFD